MLAFIFLSLNSFAALISTSVGQVQDQIVTSREVYMHFFIENALFSKAEKLKALSAPAIESKAFSQEVNNILLEKVVFIEAQNFSVSQVSPAEVNEAVKTVETRLKTKPEWTTLKASQAEMKTLVLQMLQSKKFIQFKSDSSAVPVTDLEAQQYYDSNKQRFGALPFSNFKDNIKAFLTRSQSDKRLKEWFEVLQTKYKVRNFQAEF
jgi:hypothetical protein